ncbi:OPA3-domain-containing protein [Dendrothele bispora CBS 962.96]|uniref:OPA3-domain-containing protein n=1 Tax=Dendrothele bispora (strain CBS 962.96) TaxID=1314807 RepID=A0A4S8LLG0_DENBC|nr:OPA3-domain-containing protein [Dendrothele bispora CBS 962.96]
MASAKIATLIIRTVAKPISTQLKNQAKQHETFRTFCIGLAQRLHRTETKLRTSLLGEPAKHVRPLSETRAVDSGANALAEGFLFLVAATLIIGEQWRSSRNQSKRRDNVDDRLEDLDTRLVELTTRLGGLTTTLQEQLEAERQRTTELSRILVEIGLQGGWSELEQTPLRLPRIDMSSLKSPGSSSNSLSNDDNDDSPSTDDSRIDVDTPSSESDSKDDTKSK